MAGDQTGNSFADIFPALLQDGAGDTIENSEGTTLNTINAPTMLQIAGTDLVESGTWTPTVQGQSTAGTYTVTVGSANYLRVHDLYLVEANIGFSAASGGSGNIQIQGLPANHTGNYFTGAAFLSSLDYTADYVVVNTRGGNPTDLQLTEIADNTTSGAVPITGVSTSTVIRFSLAYLTS